MDLLSAMHKSL